MLASVLDILTQAGLGAVEKIQSQTPKKTGKMARSVRFEISETNERITFQIVAAKYFKVLETGRRPTPGVKPSPEFVANVVEWLNASGGDLSKAYAVAMSINQKGTALFRAGGRDDVFSNVLNETFIDKLSIDLLQAFARDYMDKVILSLDDNSN